jgi:GDP-mannose 6-dehydrogenase
MTIGIFGLGYVGCVGLGALAELGNYVIGVDINKIKVDLINSGKATIVEKGIDELIQKNYEAGRIEGTVNSKNTILRSEVVILCVNTPNDDNGHLNMSYIHHAAEEIGEALRTKKDFLTVAIRSTVMPGTNIEIKKIIAKKSGKTAGKDFGVVSNPEFLREGSAVEDFFNPPYTILASEEPTSLEVMKSLYKEIKGNVLVTSIGTAELIKFVNNSYHALKVAFANEIGRICKALNVDSHDLMDVFVKDKILNISPYYFKPGFAYGGSCLPKDLKALNTIAHDEYVALEILPSISKSNEDHIDHAYKLITQKNKSRIGLYGISFKEGTDDLRFSGGLEIAERLLGKGYDLKIFDSNVSLSKLMGKNKEFIFSKLPHINEVLIEDIDHFLNSIDLLIIVNKDKFINTLIAKIKTDLPIIDFVGLGLKSQFLDYEGICW